MKALLLIWIGFGHSQSMAMEKFDTVAECESAKAAIIASDHAPDQARNVHCIPYEG